MSTALEYTNVVKRYGRRTALDGLNLSIPSGTVFGLVGSNGAGKTTAMSLAAGIVRHQSGTVNVLGRGPFDPSRHAGELSLMPQDANLPRYARVLDLLVFYAQLQGMSADAARQSAADVLDWLHLADRADSAISSLSHGMRRRVVVAQAFLGNPSLVLLDEPLSGLDPTEVASLRDILIQRRGKQTIVVSSHNLHEIELICDHLAFIEKGRTVRHGNMDELVRRGHLVTLIVDRAVPDMEKLKAAVPAGTFREADSKSGTWILTCEWKEDDLNAVDVNRDVLSVLLAQDVGIIELQRGSDLEQEYLAARQTGKPTT